MTIKSISISMIMVLILAISFTGCAQKTTPDPELIKKYQLNAPEVNPDETLVYLVRENSLHSGLRDALIGCNEIRYKVSNGSNIMLRLKNKINTLSITVNDPLFDGNSSSGMYPFAYFPIDNRQGEILFVYLDRDLGMFKEVDKDLGMTLVASSETKSNDTYGYDYGHQIRLLNPSFSQYNFTTDFFGNKYDNSLVSSNLMKKEGMNTPLDPNKARIIFYRTPSFFTMWDDVAFGIWTKSNLIGELKGSEYFEIDVMPGKNQFLSKYGSWGVLDADVEANKIYYVELSFVPMGLVELHPKFIAHKANTPIDEINQKILSFTKVTLDKSKIDSTMQLKLNTALPYIEKVIKAPSSVRIDSNEELKPYDGKVIQ